MIVIIACSLDGRSFVVCLSSLPPHIKLTSGELATKGVVISKAVVCMPHF
jgi:hypothetical protein